MFKIIQNAFSWCDNQCRIDIGKLPPEGITELPTKLWPFIWYFVRQVKWPTLGIAVTESIYALLVSAMLWYVGELVEKTDYTSAMVWLGSALLLIYFFTNVVTEVFYHLIYKPYIGNLIRYQLYWYTARQPLSFF